MFMFLVPEKIEENHARLVFLQNLVNSARKMMCRPLWSYHCPTHPLSERSRAQLDPGSCSESKAPAV